MTIPVTRTSPVSGKTRTLPVPATREQYRAWLGNEGAIQDLMPNLTPDQREFLMSGITPDEWDSLATEEG